ERLDRLGPRDNGLGTVTPERALAEAARADRELARGKIRGPLHGIPYGVKDLLAAAGYPTTWGAEPYRAQTFDEDATVVARLGAAGAVLVAKLAMVELAGGMGYSQANASLTGPGKPPWNVDYWGGGWAAGGGSACGWAGSGGRKGRGRRIAPRRWRGCAASRRSFRTWSSRRCRAAWWGARAPRPKA